MRIRITDCPVADLIRVQVEDDIRYVRRLNHRADGNTGRNPDVPGGIIRLVQGEEPVYQAAGTKVFLHAYRDRTEVVVLKVIPRVHKLTAA
jgi:hypothetical protein